MTAIVGLVAWMGCGRREEEVPRERVMVAVHDLAAGTWLQQGDVAVALRACPRPGACVTETNGRVHFRVLEPILANEVILQARLSPPIAPAEGMTEPDASQYPWLLVNVWWSDDVLPGARVDLIAHTPPEPGIETARTTYMFQDMQVVDIRGAPAPAVVLDASPDQVAIALSALSKGLLTPVIRSTGDTGQYDTLAAPSHGKVGSDPP